MSYISIYDLKSSNEINTIKSFKKFNNNFEINESIKLKVEQLLKKCEFDKIKEMVIKGDKFLLSRDQYIYLLSNCYDGDFYFKLYQHELWYDVNLIEESIKLDNVRIFKLLIKTFGHGWGHSNFNCIVLRFAFNQFNPTGTTLTDKRKKNDITNYISRKVKKTDLLLVIGSIIKEKISTMTSEKHCHQLIESSVYLDKLIDKLRELEKQLIADNTLLNEKVTHYNILIQAFKGVKKLVGGDKVTSDDTTVERLLFENVKNGNVKSFNFANNFIKKMQKERGAAVKGVSLGGSSEKYLNSSVISKQNHAKSIDRLEGIILEKEIERSTLIETIKYETCKLDGISSEYLCSKYLCSIIPDNFNGMSFEDALHDLMNDEEIEEIDYLYPNLHLLPRVDPIHRNIFFKYRFFDSTDFGKLNGEIGRGYRVELKYIKNKQLLAGYGKSGCFGDIDKFVSSNPSVIVTSQCLPSHFNYFKEERIINELLEFVESASSTSTNNDKNSNINNKKNNNNKKTTTTTNITTPPNNQQTRIKELEKQKEKEKEKEIEKQLTIEKKKKIELEKKKKIEKKKKLELEMKKKVDLFNDKKLKSSINNSKSSSSSSSPIQQSQELELPQEVEEEIKKEEIQQPPQELELPKLQVNQVVPQQLHEIPQQPLDFYYQNLLYFGIGNEIFKISKEDDDIDPNIQFEIDEKVESLVLDEAEENNNFNLVY